MGAPVLRRAPVRPCLGTLPDGFSNPQISVGGRDPAVLQALEQRLDGAGAAAK
jgi:hypothetical protein